MLSTILTHYVPHTVIQSTKYIYILYNVYYKCTYIQNGI